MARPWHGHGMATAMPMSLGHTSLYPDKPSPKNEPFFWHIEKEPQRPYDQNGGSIALPSLIFDPIAKETVYQKHTHFMGLRRRRRQKNFPTRPDPISSRRDIISRSGPAPHSDIYNRARPMLVGVRGAICSLWEEHYIFFYDMGLGRL